MAKRHSSSKRSGASRKGGKRSDGFKYKRRSADKVQGRATQRGGLYDSPVSGVETFTAKEGDTRLRILPPTWPNPEHYGFDVYVHYGVGADGFSYACPNKMKGEPCPICKEYEQAQQEGDEEYANKLRPTKRVAMWVIDRADRGSDVSPRLWVAPWTLDRDIAALCIDRSSGDVLFVDDPEDGFDIEFTRQGSKLRTKYFGLQVARRSTPLSDDPDEMEEWLTFIQDNPVPDQIGYHTYERMEEVFGGQVGKDDVDDDEDEQPRRKRRPAKSRDDEDEDEPQSRRSKRRRPEPDIEEDGHELDEPDADGEDFDDEDEDLDDEDDIEDDADDEDFDDEDEQDDDDEDEDAKDEVEPPPARRRSKQRTTRSQTSSTTPRRRKRK